MAHASPSVVEAHADFRVFQVNGSKYFLLRGVWQAHCVSLGVWTEFWGAL